MSEIPKQISKKQYEILKCLISRIKDDTPKLNKKESKEFKKCKTLNDLWKSTKKTSKYRDYEMLKTKSFGGFANSTGMFTRRDICNICDLQFKKGEIKRNFRNYIDNGLVKNKYLIKRNWKIKDKRNIERSLFIYEISKDPKYKKRIFTEFSINNEIHLILDSRYFHMGIPRFFNMKILPPSLIELFLNLKDEQLKTTQILIKHNISHKLFTFFYEYDILNQDEKTKKILKKAYKKFKEENKELG
jgi:hypothetical protein